MIVQLRRVIEVGGHHQINDNKVRATGDTEVTTSIGSISYFVPIAVIDHIGSIGLEGSTLGHYLCDVKSKEGDWFHTNDNLNPVKINRRKVTKKAAVVLYRKKS